MKKIADNIRLILISSIVVVAFLFLIISVFRSGYFYMFDQDEFLHSQIAYLIFKGYKPFINVYTSWIPIFHWLLVPVLAINDFSFNSLLAARIFMIALFAIRILLGFLLVNKLFGRKVSILFVFLFLFDPFTVFTAMQIRPDNLMITLFTLGLLILTYAIFNSSRLLLFYSGFILALSILTCLKIVPGISAVTIIFLIYAFSRRNFAKGIAFFSGMFFAIFVAVAYFGLQNSLFQMMQQVILDAATLHKSIYNWTGLGYFYAPGNDNLYGLSGKPLNWVYVWILPILAFMGVFQVIQKFFTEPDSNHKQKIIFIILTTAFIFHWLSLFFYHSVFLQYYIPISWFYALFSAVIISHFDKLIQKFVAVNLFYRISLFILGTSLVIASTAANNRRATVFSYEWQYPIVSSRWAKIPKDSYVFPFMIFRPIADPFLPLFSFTPGLPTSIINRYPPLLKTLKNYNVSYVFISEHISYYYIIPEIKAYIGENFAQDQQDKELWIRR